MKYAMVDVHEAQVMTSYYKIVNTIHDELLIDTRQEYKEETEIIVMHRMLNAVTLTVPLGVEGAWGQNWAEVH